MSDSTPIHSQPSWDAVIPASVRYDARLKKHGDVKSLYGEIRSLCNREGYCWASNEYFAQTFSISTRTITRWIGLLEKCGHITAYHGMRGFKRLRKIYLGNETQNIVKSRHGCLDRVDTDVHLEWTPVSHNKESNDEEREYNDLCKGGEPKSQHKRTGSLQKSSHIKGSEKRQTEARKSKIKHSQDKQPLFEWLKEQNLGSDDATLSYTVSSYSEDRIREAIVFTDEEAARGVNIRNRGGFVRKILDGGIIARVGQVEKNRLLLNIFAGNISWTTWKEEFYFIVDKQTPLEVSLKLDSNAFMYALQEMHDHIREKKI